MKIIDSEFFKLIVGSHREHFLMIKKVKDWLGNKTEEEIYYVRIDESENVSQYDLTEDKPHLIEVYRERKNTMWDFENFEWYLLEGKEAEEIKAKMMLLNLK